MLVFFMLLIVSTCALKLLCDITRPAVVHTDVSVKI